ncbi:MAG: exodeoxyribonuclease VII large subunit [Actinobacteria bacterium HGW-Actinobacteria-7]|jgi:exodeoxyribonuclease VII large subunit|nr:MAG: exodeoxyribonuclease VII large subunit [Actinobacteria bacterium HGW-Actinobacteria-7]
MTQAKRALEGVRVRVVGEVSEFNDKPGYKAAYFTVCDAGAAMPCLMWRDVYDAGGISLRCGMLVELSGQFSAYVPKGRMQFTVRTLSLAGEGRLRMQVSELARKLEAEGLMRPDRKKPLPRYPERIAVVTSPRGKAIHDVIRTLRRRYPLAELLVAGVQVEGEGAPTALAEGLHAAQAAAPDVILLVRGGGSYEDLMPFNSEEVARAVAECPVPVVTGIGHEPDTSIADMVADVRASTPTGAAEAAAPSIEELGAVLMRERRAIGRALQSRVQRLEHRMARLAERPVFSDPYAILGPASQRIDSARARLDRALPERLKREQQRVQFARERLTSAGPRITERARSKLGLAAARLEDLSPLAILARGYSASFGSDGCTVIRSVSQVTAGDRLFVRVSDGRIGCTVTDTKEG